MKLYLTNSGCVVEKDLNFYSIGDSWDQLAFREDLGTYLKDATTHAPKVAGGALALLAPIGTQEVWAAGVTYLRSRAARMEEAKSAGGGDFYDRVYNAERLRWLDRWLKGMRRVRSGLREAGGFMKVKGGRG
jgi:2-dehydro-3-deoxy-D-arabinonate dehydratase